MERITLRVRLFGPLSLAIGGTQIGCESNRSGQVWALLSYLLYHRKRVIPADELIRVLHMEENGSGSLKTAIHRVRTVLDRLGDNMGHTLLQFRDGGYGWNPDVIMELDTEQFDSAVTSPANPEQLLEALDLYTDTFCSMHGAEAWVLPVSAYYHNLYLRAVQDAAGRLEGDGQYEECAALCRRALKLDTSQEFLYQLLMRSLLALNRRSEVIAIYEEMSKLLLTDFGILPDQESRALYREALRTVNEHTITPDVLREQLQERGPVSGALLCDFDFFRNVYQAQARVLARSGDSVHIALLHVIGEREKNLSRRSLETAMDNLETHICRSLRKGDMVARCSASQIVIMLPHAGYEDSLKVCQRLYDSYMRKYPRSPIRIEYSVQELEAVK